MNDDMVKLSRVVIERCAALDVETIDSCPQNRHAECRALAVEIAAVASATGGLLRQAGRKATIRRSAAELFLGQRLIRVNVDVIVERCPAHRESLREALTLASELDRVCSQAVDRLNV